MNEGGDEDYEDQEGFNDRDDEDHKENIAAGKKSEEASYSDEEFERFDDQTA